MGSLVSSWSAVRAVALTISGVANDINPDTFCNWISRLRKKGMVIPNDSLIRDPVAMPSQKDPAVEIFLRNSTCWFFP